MTHRIFSSIFISFSVLRAVCRSFLANHQGNNKWIPLPAVNPAVDTSLTVEQLVARVDKLVRMVVLNTAHPCLYFSYARCCVLRKWGYRAKLNLGMHNLHGKCEADGHCWISLDGHVYFEEKDPLQIYPDAMGEYDDVVYWARLKENDDKECVKLKK